MHAHAENLLDLLLRRFREAEIAPPAPLTVLAGPHIGRSSGLPTPRLAVAFTGTTRRPATLDGGVENRIALELSLDDAATGEESAMRRSLRWAAWIESALLPEAERDAAPLGGLAESLDPVDTAFEAGGPGLGAFTLRLRYAVTVTS